MRRLREDKENGQKKKFPISNPGFTWRALIWSLLLTMSVVFVFYRSLWGLIPGMAVGVYGYMCEMKRAKAKDEMRRLREFRSFITAMEGPLQAGMAIEQAVKLAEKDLRDLYGERISILKDVRRIHGQMKLGYPFEESFETFAQREDIPEIQDFSDVICSLKRTGGNAIQIIESTIRKIMDGIQLKDETETIIAARQLEQRIMTLMPAIILTVLSLSSPTYLSALYHGIFGRGIMTLALGLNLVADVMGKRIVQIH